VSIELLATYVPIDRRQALAQGIALPEQTNASVLLADISGFTPLTESFVGALGPRRGAEELTAILNRIYTSLVSSVHAYGGSVVCFIGDALVAQFPGDDGRRAVACALAMQDAMRGFEPVAIQGSNAVKMEMKAAVEAGPLRRFLVGDPGIQRIDVLAGATVDRLADGEHLAERGEVIVSSALAESLGGALIVAEHREKHAVVQRLATPIAEAPWSASITSSLDKESLRPFVLPEVWERTCSGQGDFLAELRPIAALFLRFGGLNYDEDLQAGERLDALTSWVQQAVHGYGGHVLMLTTADKGSHLYAAFGALEAHEDDADRAVAAALALKKIPADLTFAQDLQIGIARGRVRVGGYGGEGRRTYGAMGNPVNLAARLMGIAPAGSIRCSSRIHAVTSERFLYDAHPPVTLKGMTESRPVYEPREERSADGTLRAVDLVGRDEETERLRSLITEVRGGARRVLFVEGEAGIGKSSMIGELHRLAGHRGFAWLLGAAPSIERNAPYRAWRPIVASLLEIAPGASGDERQRCAVAAIAEADAAYVERAPLLNDVLGFDLPETAITKSYDPQLRREAIASLIGGLLRRRTEASPLVLVLDDAHWLDSASWELTLSAARSLVDCPALLVLVHRPISDPASRPFCALRDLSDTSTLALDTLPPEATVALAAARVGLRSDDLPAEVREFLEERAEGNPFYALELIGTLRDQKLIWIAEGSCTIRADAETLRESVPDTLEGVVLSRIDQLPVEEQLTVKVASVIGRSFLLRALQAVLPGSVPSDELTARLDHTGRRRLTEQEAVDPEPGYAFQHAVTRDVAYDTLLFEQRRELHHGVAGWLESAYAELLAPHYPLLAFHWHFAGELEKELEYVNLSAKQATEQFANEEALQFHSRAVELIEALDADPTSARRLDALQSRAGILAILGLVDEERADLETLRTLCTEKDDRCLAEVDLLWAGFHRRGGRFREGIKEADRALERLHALEDEAGEARALTCVGRCLEGLGQFAEARGPIEEAVAIYRGTDGLDSLAGEAVRALGIIHARLGQFPQAMERFGEAHELFRCVGDRKGEAEVFANLGAVSYYFGEYETSIRNSRRAEVMFRELGNRSGAAKCLANTGSAYRDVGAFEQALTCHEQALRLFRQLDDANECAGNTYNVACDLHALGVGGYPNLSFGSASDPSCLLQAIDGFETALAQYTTVGSQWGKVLANLRIGCAWLNAGDDQRAEPYLRVALDLSREVGMASQEMQALSALSRLMLHRGEGERALALSDEVMAKLGDSKPPCADELQFTRYRVLSSLGKHDAALPHLAESRACVMEYAGSIRDPDLEAGFLHACREILEA